MSQTYDIPFTRFSLPDGRRSDDTMSNADPEVWAAYERIRDAGCIMTVEMLSNGMIIAAIQHYHGDYDWVGHSNGPGLTEKVSEMMKRFTVEDFRIWLAAETDQ